MTQVSSDDFKKNACIEINLDDFKWISSERMGRTSEWRTKLTGQIIKKMTVDDVKIKFNKKNSFIKLTEIILKEKS